MRLNKKVLGSIRRMVRVHPDEVMDALLKQVFWPTSLKSDTAYTRKGDDTDGSNSHILVMFSRDSDGWIEVVPHLDPDAEQFSTSHRFRTSFGGGRSLHVRNALLMLARAVELDNKERPDPPCE